MSKKIQLLIALLSLLILMCTVVISHLYNYTDFTLPIRTLSGYYELGPEFSSAAEANMSILIDTNSNKSTITSFDLESDSIISIDCDIIMYDYYKKEDTCTYTMTFESDIDHPLTNKKIKAERNIISGELFLYSGDVVLALFIKDNVLSLYI